MEGLGIDIGGVIIARSGANDTSFLTEDYLNTPELPGAMQAIQRLVEGRFGPRVFLVSKAGPRARTRTMRWLKHNHFFERTGIKPKHIQFCLERNEKELICRELGLTHFIDDRLDVLASLKSVPNRFLFDPSSIDGSGVPRSIVVVKSWLDFAGMLLGRHSD